MTSKPNNPKNPIEMDYIGVDDSHTIDKKSKNGRTVARNIKKKKKHKRNTLIFKITVIVLIVIAIIMTTCYAIFLIGKNQMTSTDDAVIKPPESIGAVPEDEGKIVAYKDSLYKLNENMASILIMGIDKYDMSTDGSYGANGQADSIFLMAIDSASGRVSIIPINRDTMVDANVYTESGEFAGSKRQQICLVWSNADGKDKSAENTKSAVSGIFYGLPINSYFAMDINGIGVLNNAVGGVTVTPPDSFDYMGTSYIKDTPIKLDTADKALGFVKWRDVTKLDSNETRMQRQLTFVKAFAANTLAKTKTNLTFPIKLYNIVKEYNYNNFNTSKLSFMVSTIMNSYGEGSINFKKIEGKTELVDNMAEFTPDDEQLFELILETFYIEIEEEK